MSSLLTSARQTVRLAPCLARSMANSANGAIKHGQGILHHGQVSGEGPSGTGERFGNTGGDSGWRWENNGIGMGGKDAGPGTQAKPGMGKGDFKVGEIEYNVPEFFEYGTYGYFDIEKQMVDGNVRVPQPKSGLSEFWS